MTTTLLIDVEVDYNYTAATPAKLSGPPEDCYEGDDAEVDITSVKFAGSDIMLKLTEEQLTQLNEEAMKDAEESRVDAKTAWALQRAEDHEEDDRGERQY